MCLMCNSQIRYCFIKGLVAKLMTLSINFTSQGIVSVYFQLHNIPETWNNIYWPCPGETWWVNCKWYYKNGSLSMTDASDINLWGIKMFPEDFCNMTKSFWKRFKLLCIFQSFNREREVRQLVKYVSLRLSYRRYYTNVAEVYYLLIPVNVYANLFKKNIKVSLQSSNSQNYTFKNC